MVPDNLPACNLLLLTCLTEHVTYRTDLRRKPAALINSAQSTAPSPWTRIFANPCGTPSPPWPSTTRHVVLVPHSWYTDGEDSASKRTRYSNRGLWPSCKQQMTSPEYPTAKSVSNAVVRLVYLVSDGCCQPGACTRQWVPI
jgi:hypothetical protein